MNASKILNVETNGWNSKVTIKCGSVSHEFDKVNWERMSRLFGLAGWMRDNSWALDIAFPNASETALAEDMYETVKEYIGGGFELDSRSKCIPLEVGAFWTPDQSYLNVFLALVIRVLPEEDANTRVLACVRKFISEGLNEA